MGLYIDPLRGSKEEWLAAHATAVDPGIFGDSLQEQWLGMCEDDSLPICYVLNSAFSALGVAYSLSEFRRFTAGMQDRPHKWYTAPRSELRKLPGLSKI